MWDTKYRPARFSDVLGQGAAVEVLKARLSKGTALDTSYLFSGGHGQGKTTLARILGKAILCQSLTADQEPCNECESCKDINQEASATFFEMDAASNGTIDHARALVSGLGFFVPGGKKRVYLFDEAHRMGVGAQDVLLKPIEEKRLVGLFCTTEAEKIRGTIRSRCEEFPIRKISREDILVRMKMVLGKEGVEHEDDAVLTVIDHAGGHVRDVLNKLEMISQLGPITIDLVRDHLNLSVVSTYYQILLALAEPATALKLAEEACERVSSSEVAEGLAEAAMNTYRLKHGMFAEFSSVDRGLADKVYALYGDNVVHFAEYFLRSTRTSRIGLFSDLLACRAGVPAKTEAAPIRISLAAPTPQGLPEAPESPALPTVQKLPETVAKSDVAPANGSRRPDGVGNMGSGDARALTSLDTKAVPTKDARGKEAPKVRVPSGPRETFLTPDEWRRSFMMRLAVLRGEA